MRKPTNTNKVSHSYWDDKGSSFWDPEGRWSGNGITVTSAKGFNNPRVEARKRLLRELIVCPSFEPVHLRMVESVIRLYDLFVEHYGQSPLTSNAHECWQNAQCGEEWHAMNPEEQSDKRVKLGHFARVNESTLENSKPSRSKAKAKQSNRRYKSMKHS